MARRQKNSAGRIVFLIAVVLVLLMFLTFAIGAAIVIGWLFREVTFPQRVAVLRNKGFEPTWAKLAAIGELEGLNRQLVAEREAIEEEGSNLSRRKDGYFQERSRVAKALNARLEPVVGRASAQRSSFAFVRRLLATGSRSSSSFGRLCNPRGWRSCAWC